MAHDQHHIDWEWKGQQIRKSFPRPAQALHFPSGAGVLIVDHEAYADNATLWRRDGTFVRRVKNPIRDAAAFDYGFVDRGEVFLVALGDNVEQRCKVDDAGVAVDDAIFR